MRIAIIGSGISGSLTARLLNSRHDVTLFESADYAGGHAQTIEVKAFGRKYLVDTAFMVFNRRTYPNFCRLLELLEITSQVSDMSFSVRCSRTGLEYQGSSPNGIFSQRRNLIRPAFLLMLRDIARFNRSARMAVANNELGDSQTVRQFVQRHNLCSTFVDQYLVPMAAAIWSSNPNSILDYPAEFMIGFFANHGLLELRNRPTWRTIVGGSRQYVHALLAPLGDDVRLSCPIASVRRCDDHVVVTSESGSVESFDQVVFATHADQTLNMLADASPTEKSILGEFPYQPNEAVLHTDTSCLPRRRRAWASWNYHLPRDKGQSASVTYDLSRLQSLDTPSPLLLTLNETDAIDPAKILRRFTYHHPAYSRTSLATQRRHAEISGKRRTHYCGAYWGFGFHEDGAKSALAVCESFGITLSSGCETRSEQFGALEEQDACEALLSELDDDPRFEVCGPRVEQVIE